MDGILNVNKPTGMTSHDVVAKVRKLLKQRRVGHAGTLDPAASGVLPICIGQGTRVAEYLSASGKAYSAEIIFGVVTDTYDGEGSILRRTNVDNLTLAQIQDALQHFVGPQMQLPPRYSAIKLQGQPAYKRARAGEEFPLEARPIVIHQLTLMAWQMPRLTLEIECSKGTYIRSLAYDLGEHLGCGAYLAALVRTRSGPFSLAECITLDQLTEMATAGTIEQHIHHADMVLAQYPALHLDEATTERVQHGNPFSDADITAVTGERRNDELAGSAQQQPLTLARVYDVAGNLTAIAEWDAEQQLWQPKKVFVS